ncbi:hypothetical protein YC2023_018688 [Brassica napus]
MKVRYVLFNPQIVVFGLKHLVPRNFLGIFRGNSKETLIFLGIPSEYSEEIPRKKRLWKFRWNSDANGLFIGISSEFLKYPNGSLTAIIYPRNSSVFSEEYIFPRYSIRIFRRIDISSEYRRYIPRKFRGTQILCFLGISSKVKMANFMIWKLNQMHRRTVRRVQLHGKSVAAMGAKTPARKDKSLRLLKYYTRY